MCKWEGQCATPTEAGPHESAVGIAQRELDSLADADLHQTLIQLVLIIVSCASHKSSRRRPAGTANGYT